MKCPQEHYHLLRTGNYCIAYLAFWKFLQHFYRANLSIYITCFSITNHESKARNSVLCLQRVFQLETLFSVMQTILHTEYISVLIWMFFNKLHTYVSTLMTPCTVKVLEMTMYFLKNLLEKNPLELPGVFCLLNWDSCQILHTIKFTWAFF